MQTWSKFTTLFILRLKKKSMACTEKIAIRSSDPNHVVQIPLSLKVTEGYLKKTSTIGIDAVLIDRKPLEPGCLPQVESIDLLCYLVVKTSFYTQKQLKPSAVSRPTIKWCRALFTTLKNISSQTSSWCWQKCGTRSARAISWFTFGLLLLRKGQ